MAVDSSNVQSAFNPGQAQQQLQASMQAGKGSAPAKSMDDLLMQILSGPVKWLSKAVGVKFDSFLETGALPFKLEDGGAKFINNSINVAAATLTSQGGALAATLGIIASKENFLAGIGGLPIEAQQQIASIRDLMPEGMPVSSLSYGELGTLSPPSMGNMSRAEGMGMMA
jgi:hypothetical protein